jgi:putative hydrolase of the HAD superfamily
MTVAAVVFDLDYTLAVPDRSRQEILDEATDAAGVDAIDRQEYLGAHSDDLASETRTPIFESVLNEGDPAAVASAYRRAIEDALVEVPGATELLRDLRREYRVGLLTDGPVRAQQGKLARLGWEDHFDGVVITGALPAGKPDPRAFDAVVSELGITPETTVFVGDHPDADVRGAKDAGMLAVQVLGDRFERAPEADAYVERTDLERQLQQFLCHQTCRF